MPATLVAAGAFWLSACTAPRRNWIPPQDPATLSDALFLHYLALAPTVTVDEGTRAVLLLIGPTEQWPTFEDRRAELERRKAFRPAWALQPDDTLDKGTLGYMLVALCELPRGLNDTLSRASGLGDRRYALKTCHYQGLLPYGLAHEAVTGGELLSALTAAESRVPEAPAAER